MSRKVALGFALFCLLRGSRWLLNAVAPSPVPVLPGLAVESALLAVLLLGWSTARERNLGRHRGRFAEVAGLTTRGQPWLVGALGFTALALPELVAALGKERVSGSTQELVFLLMPVAVVFTLAQTSGGFGQDEDIRQLFGPALASIAGAMLLMPFTVPSSALGRLLLAALGVSVVAAGVAAVRLHRLLRTGEGIARTAGLLAAATAMAAAPAAAGQWRLLAGVGARDWAVEGAETVLLGTPLLLLAVALLQAMPPVRFAARVPGVLLVALVGTAIPAQPRLTWTLAAGFTLLAGGAGWLLWQGGAEPG